MIGINRSWQWSWGNSRRNQALRRGRDTKRPIRRSAVGEEVEGLQLCTGGNWPKTEAWKEGKEDVFLESSLTFNLLDLGSVALSVSVSDDRLLGSFSFFCYFT